MSPSRRQFLRASVVSLPFVAGCAGGGSTDATTRPRAQTGTTEATTATEATTTTDDGPESLACGPGSLPESGWPLPARSVGGLSYAPSASGPTSKPTADWTITADEPDANDAAFTRPVVADGRVFTGRALHPPPQRPMSDDQEVHAYDAASGERHWRAPVPGRPRDVFALPESVVVRHDEGVTGLDRSDGAELWTAGGSARVERVLPTPAGILATARLEEASDELRAYGDGGELAWRVAVPGRIESSLAWADDRAYLVSAGGELVAVDTDDRSVAWTRNLQDGEDTHPTSVAAVPCGAVAIVDGVLYGVNRSGTELWRAETGSREVAFDGDTAYGVGADGHVRAVDAADGEPGWRAFFGRENRQYTDGFLYRPAFDGDALYAGTLDGKLVAASAADGDERWVLERDWDGEARVAVTGSTLYAAWGRRLVAYR